MAGVTPATHFLPWCLGASSPQSTAWGLSWLHVQGSCECRGAQTAVSLLPRSLEHGLLSLSEAGMTLFLCFCSDRLRRLSLLLTLRPTCLPASLGALPPCSACSPWGVPEEGG